MQQCRLALPTRSRRRYRSLPQLPPRCREGSFHSRSRLGRLHLRQKRIEFVGERIKPGLGCARERVEVLDGDQHRLGGIVLGDHDSATLNGHVQHPPEFALRLACADRRRFKFLASTVSEGSDNVLIRALPWNHGRGRPRDRPCRLPFHMSIVSNIGQIVNFDRRSVHRGLRHVACSSKPHRGGRGV